MEITIDGNYSPLPLMEFTMVKVLFPIFKTINGFLNFFSCVNIV